MNKGIIIGITGGTGSGKSTISNAIIDALPKESIAVVEQDSYYKEQDELSFEERVKTNYDHPLAFDMELLCNHLKALKEGMAIEKPIYNFEIHNRMKTTTRIQPKDIIILEGIMLFEEQSLRELIDIKIYVDTDADIRILRRIQRDIEERGRTLESVINQYLSTVRPAHEQFIEPYKKYADIIVPEGGQNHVAIDMVVTKIQSVLRG